MMLSFKKIIFACISYTLAWSASFCQEGILGNDAPENFTWSVPAKDDIAFNLISLDGKTHSFYVNKGNFFAPVETRSRNLGRKYSIPRSDKIVFYNRQEIADGAKGKALYVPAISIDAKDSIDWVIGMFSRGKGNISARGIDISLENMPPSTLTMVNMGPSPLGFQIGKKAFKLGFFESYKSPEHSGSSKILSHKISSFSLRGPKPVFITTSVYSHWSFERMLILLFEEQKEEKSMGVAAVDPPPPEQPKTESANASVIIIKSKGPRQ